MVSKVKSITRSSYGELDAQEVTLYTITNARGLVMKVTNYGATITELHTPDRSGHMADIVAGFATLAEYRKDSPYFGTIAGRVANRIRNAEFELEGRRYALANNDGKHHLHGGRKGFDKVLWDAQAAETPAGSAITLTYASEDGEEGYPGTIKATVTYMLSDENELCVDMTATTDKTTLINLVQHSYWNLGGIHAGAISDHELTLYADNYTPGDPVVPTGEIRLVEGTPFDFTKAKRIGRDLEAAGGTPVGYDHNWVVNGHPHEMRPVALLRDPRSGRFMTLAADQPGVQFYSGNFLDGSIRGKGVTYVNHGALCLETQKFPNSINVPAWRDETILRAGEVYKHTMVHKFGAE